MFYKIFIFILMVYMSIGSSPSFAGQSVGVDERLLAKFFGVPVGGIYIECPQKSFEIRKTKENQELRMCLSPWDHENRCEVSIVSLPKFPIKTRISMQVKPSRETPSDRWHSILQIQTFPDKGEAWRCPPFSLETMNERFRAYSRWDASPLSRTSGYHCTESGSSISAQEVISGIPVAYGEWQSISLDMFLSPYNEEGWLSLKIGQSAATMKGGNTYNDKKLPYLKLGIYKPSGWEEQEKRAGLPNCVTYRNVKIVSLGAQ